MSDAGEGKERSVDGVLAAIADYAMGPAIESGEARDAARLCLMDALGCGLAALEDPACVRRLGPIVEGAELRGVAGGSRVPGLGYELDPVHGAFNVGCMIRWLDYNDTWLAAEWGHPSDNFGGILAAADWLSRRRVQHGGQAVTVGEVLEAGIRAYEIQGVLSLANAFNRVGLDHVLLVRAATAAVVTRLLGGDWKAVVSAVSNAFLDAGPLRAYRHAPNVGWRKSWAAGDATSRGVRLALMALDGEEGYPAALSAEKWGFCDALFGGREIEIPQPFGSYVIERILFKVAYPAEFHAQTAVEAAVALSPAVHDRLGEVERIRIETQEPAMRIINKTGPLYNPADRDHCLQYMTAVGLIHGTLRAEHYRDEAAADERIDRLRERMEVVERQDYSRDYLDPEKRSIPNAVQVFFKGGEATERVEVQYPLGHMRRRDEALPLLRDKFERNIAARLSEQQRSEVVGLFDDPAALEATGVDALMERLVS